jgi:hypothetical protein
MDHPRQRTNAGQRDSGTAEATLTDGPAPRPSSVARGAPAPLPRGRAVRAPFRTEAESTTRRRTVQRGPFSVTAQLLSYRSICAKMRSMRARQPVSYPPSWCSARPAPRSAAVAHHSQRPAAGPHIRSRPSTGPLRAGLRRFRWTSRTDTNHACAAEIAFRESRSALASSQKARCRYQRAYQGATLTVAAPSRRAPRGSTSRMPGIPNDKLRGFTCTGRRPLCRHAVRRPTRGARRASTNRRSKPRSTSR